MANVIVSALATWNGKALKKGKQELNAFDKTVKSLGKTFAGVFSATALLNYSKNAVKAFMADEKAAKSLELQLKNTGYAFSSPAVEDYISKLQKSTGVLDDELRPSFQRLLTVTKSITQSQDALALALDLSAAGYGSLEQISTSLAKAYAGQTTALGRLGTGLSKATLATGNMDKIMSELQQKFAGQAQARLTTYAGKMDLLKVASENVKEEIGKGILGALDALSRDTSIEDTTTKMENFGKATGDAITGVGLLIAELKKIPGAEKGADILFGTNIFSLLGKLAEEDRKSKAGTKPNLEPRFASRVYLQQLRLENKISAARKLELALLDAINKKRTEVEKLQDKFNVERIGLMTALNAATDEETKLRIKAQLAILDNNEALAKKYNAELEATSATKALAESSNKAAGALSSFGPALFNALGEMTARGRSQIAPMEEGSRTYTVPQGATNQSAQAPAGGNGPSVGVTVNAGTIVTDQQLEAVIQQNVLQLLKSGNKLLPVGSL